MRLTKEILKNKKVAIYGGSFNPIHIGHLLTGIYIKENLGYDLIIFIPANIPVHKDTLELIDPLKRIEMIKLSIKNIKYFLLSDIEIKRGGNSYTIDTVMELKEMYEYNDKFGIIIGDDLVPGLSQWKNIDLLQNICNIICFRRGNDIPLKTDYKIKFINNKIIDISSNDIRNRVKKNLPIDFMVTENVKNYILKNKLYR